MATSIKLKFIPSKIKGKAGVICLQLIHNRKIKLLRTQFRLFPAEWDSQKETVFFGNSDMEDVIIRCKLHNIFLCMTNIF